MKLPINYRNATFQERRQARKQYIEEQKELCAYCNQPLYGKPSEKVLNATINWDLFPPNFQKYPIHLHHSHDTGLTIGAIHMRCNAYLWQYEGE